MIYRKANDLLVSIAYVMIALIYESTEQQRHNKLGHLANIHNRSCYVLGRISSFSVTSSLSLKKTGSDTEVGKSRMTSYKKSETVVDMFEHITSVQVNS